MFIILEWNGILPEGWMGVVLNKDGTLKVWKDYKKVTKWAKENCAFEWKIVILD